MSLRPSSLPMLAACPCFESAEYTGAKDKFAGTARHKLFAALLWAESEQAKLRAVREAEDSGLEDSDIEAVQWAVDYFWCHAQTAEFRMRTERHVHPLNPETFQPLFPNGGTLDAACGPDLFDLKHRERDYGAQFSAYALAIFQEHPEFQEVRCHALFTESKRARTWSVTEASASSLVCGIIARATAPDRKPNVCDYCSWCANIIRCEPHLKAVETVAHGYAELESVKNWHPSQFERGADFANALFVWRQCLKKWGESLEFHALEAAEKRKMDIPGYELRVTQGRQYITDVPAAFAAAGLPQQEFLRCCAVRLNSSKTYKDQVGLVETLKDFSKLDKTAVAKREIERKLGDLIKRGNPSTTLRPVKGSQAETENTSE